MLGGLKTRNDMKFSNSYWRGDRRLVWIYEIYTNKISIPKFPKLIESPLIYDVSTHAREQDGCSPESGNCYMKQYGNCGIRIENIATAKNVVAKITMFPHRNDHKIHFDPDGKTQPVRSHVRKRWPSSILYYTVPD